MESNCQKKWVDYAFFLNNFIIRSRNEDGDQSGAQEDSGRIPACATRMRRMQQINHRQVKGIFNSAIFNTAMRLICAGICWERWTCSGTKIASNADAATVDWGRSDRHSTPEPIWFCAAETISGNHADISLLHITHAHTHTHTHTHWTLLFHANCYCCDDGAQPEMECDLSGRYRYGGLWYHNQIPKEISFKSKAD